MRMRSPKNTSVEVIEGPTDNVLSVCSSNIWHYVVTRTFGINYSARVTVTLAALLAREGDDDDG